MNKYQFRTLVLAGLLVGARASQADGGFEASTPELGVRVVAEVQVRSNEHGTQHVRMLPADKVVPGDVVYYTLEVRNAGSHSLQSPSVVQRVPAHMIYLANSASGPGCEVTFSVDGGHSYARPEGLQVAQPDGSQRPAEARDYTHIRYQMASLVKANSVAFLRFRAQVK